MTKAKDLEIPIEFHNYKLLKDKSWVLKGSYIYFVQGPNKTGKTSFLLALQGAMTAKDVTDKKVSINEDGEDSGHYEFTIPDADGEMVTIRNEFTDQKNKFIAIKADGEKVSKVGDIRQMFNYTPINVNEFFQMSRSADGRRRQRDIILKLLPDELREKFEEADLSESHYFTQRTEVGRNLEISKGYQASCIISDEQRKLLSKEKEASELLNKYEIAVDIRKSNNTLQERRNEQLNEKIRLQELIDAIDVKLEKLIDLKEDNITIDISDGTLVASILKGKDVITKIQEIKAKDKLLIESTERVNNLTTKQEELTVEIDKRRNIKTKIVAEADLPVKNISFEDDYLVIDDFKFDENQVCESDAVLLLANILAKINPGPIQVIGDASILDANKLEELNKIAEANNKVMFVDEVIRDSDSMVVVGYDTISKIPTQKQANAKSTKITSKAKESIPETTVSPNKDEASNENNKDNKKLLF